MAELYRHFDCEDNLLYVGISKCTPSRTNSHLKSFWFDSVTKITIERFKSRESAHKAEKKAIRTERPIFNTHYTSGYKDLRKKPHQPFIPRHERLRSKDLTSEQISKIEYLWNNNSLSEFTRLARIKDAVGRALNKNQVYYICVTKPKRKRT